MIEKIQLNMRVLWAKRIRERFLVYCAIYFISGEKYQLSQKGAATSNGVVLNTLICVIVASTRVHK